MLLVVLYPWIITNEELYRITGTYDIRTDIINFRWKYLGHVLRKRQHMWVIEEYLQGESEDVHKVQEYVANITLLQRDINMINGK